MSHFVVIDLSCFLWESIFGSPPSKVHLIAISKIVSLLKELQPSHVAAACDLPWPTWRHDLMPKDYKAHRQGTREQERTIVQGQTGKCRELLEDVLGIPTIGVRGYEADDVVATLVSLSKAEKTTILGIDKDFLQLVDSGTGPRKRVIEVMNPKSKFVWTMQNVYDQWGVWPDQFIAYQALVGDGADGYPGCPGIGPKQALLLLRQYFSLENIMKSARGNAVNEVAAALEDTPPDPSHMWYKASKPSPVYPTHKGIQLVYKHRKDVELSAKLATLHTSVPGVATMKYKDFEFPPLPPGVFEQ